MLNKKIQTLRVIVSTTINLWKAFGISVIIIASYVSVNYFFNKKKIMNIYLQARQKIRQSVEK